ncbi:S8 family serine peptidase [candidate division GN15 bacterium]|nr:S8 family serine peptidase [candidate division GN15 bacterium]
MKSSMISSRVMLFAAVSSVFSALAFAGFPPDATERDFGVIVQFSYSISGLEECSSAHDVVSLDVSDAELQDIIESNGVYSIRRIHCNAARTKFVGERAVDMPYLDNTYVFTCQSRDRVRICTVELRNHDAVIYAEPNYMEVLPSDCPGPVDPYYDRDPSDPYQWWFTGARGDSSVHINIEPAWDITCGEANSRIGLFDSGVMTTHQDIGARCTNIGGQTNAHGTWVYGIMAANADSVGIVGMVQDAEVISWNIINYSLAAYADSIISAVDNWDCDVLGTSCSILTYRYSYDIATTLKNAIEYAYDSYVPFVAAAGNHEFGYIYQPACIDEVIAVGASDTTGAFRDNDSDGVPDYNHGRLLDLLAPGEWMITTSILSDSDYYLCSWGTSFSQPIVTGAIALMESARSDLSQAGFSVEDYEGMLYAYAEDLETAGYDTLTGWGEIDVGKSVQNMFGRYSLHSGYETGGSLADSTSRFRAIVYGFYDEGLKNGTWYPMKQYTIEKQVSWPQYANSDSVFCWGKSHLSNGLRDYVRKWSFKPDTGENFHKVFNRKMCYPIHSTIGASGATFRSHFYKVFYSTTDSVIAVLGESNPDSVVFSFAAVGPDSIPAKSFSGEARRYPSRLSGNYPNPFNPSTTIMYCVAGVAEQVRVVIYDARGAVVVNLVDERRQRGEHTVTWNGKDEAGREVSAGVYLARISVGADYRDTRKLVLVR